MDRDNWGSKAEFLLACIGYCVGLGNLWRFPYLVYESGGGVFLIPYFIMLFLVGIPLLYMELSIGLITQRGPVHSIKALCPFFKGNFTRFAAIIVPTLIIIFDFRNRIRNCRYVISIWLLLYNNYSLLPLLFL